ncbi:hypothetical protein O181_107247 [Austropuccinia psidii MF-1]|uniref:CCHC-type domain-containing protein n=1 Tax=Austropuccinia psidii MF-1 TaxID=1389203 RepID=A0A9Q3PP63_9BASI|nr:hypothetical protein [Austropuccinia psidii MF-1]
MSQYAEQSAKQCGEIKAGQERMRQTEASLEQIVKNLQEGYAQLNKASEESKKRLNILFEEQHHSTRGRECLDQDINKLFNAYHSLKPQPQGQVMDNPSQPDEIKPAAILMNKARSPSQYQDGYGMSYSEKEALKQLPEASNWPKLSGAGEYDHMELIDSIDGLFIDVPSIPDYWITGRLNTAFEGHASIWYTEMKEIHGRRNWPWWKSQISQKYSNGTWIWQKTMSFENDKYSVNKDPYEWCLRQYDIANTLQDIRKRTNIGKFTPYKSSGFKEKQPFRVEFKDKPKERVAEVAKKRNYCHNCGSTDHYANNCPKEKKKVYAIEKVAEVESPTEDSESDSMGDSIREPSDDDQDPREEFLVDYQEETPQEIKDI